MRYGGIHRHIDMGFNQKQAVAVLYVISAILGLSAVVLTTSGPVKAMLLLCTAFDPKGMGRFDQAMAHCPAQVIKIVPEVITGKEHEMHQEPSKAHTCHS